MVNLANLHLVESCKAKIVRLGVFAVNYDESIQNKLRQTTDGLCIRYYTDLASDQFFPDNRTGSKLYRVAAVRFWFPIRQADLEEWCMRKDLILARPKDGIDLARARARPALDNVMPLVIAGQFTERGDALYFCRSARKRILVASGLGRESVDRQWPVNRWFLVLEDV
jgi:hypothetical protein